MDLLPQAMGILEDELPNIEVKLLSDYSHKLADALTTGRLDAAFMRPECRLNALARPQTRQYHVLLSDDLAQLFI